MTEALSTGGLVTYTHPPFPPFSLSLSLFVPLYLFFSRPSCLFLFYSFSTSPSFSLAVPLTLSISLSLSFLPSDTLSSAAHHTARLQALSVPSSFCPWALWEACT